MAIFDRLDRMTSRVVDRQFSVGATIDAMLSTPNGRNAPDPARGEILLRGVFDQMPAYDAIEIGKRERTGNDLRALSAGNQCQFSYDTMRYPGEIRQGDRLTLDDARRFQVVSVRPDGMARVVLELVRL